MGVRHTLGYLNTGRFEVAAISDMNSDAMDEMDARFGADQNYRPDRFTDPNRMLDSQKFDVVSICTWHREHAVWTIAAATRKPQIVITEKPMAENLGRAHEMRTVCERNGVKLAVAHQRRFVPSYTLARQMIADGVIGSVEFVYSSRGLGTSKLVVPSRRHVSIPPRRRMRLDNGRRRADDRSNGARHPHRRRSFGCIPVQAGNPVLSYQRSNRGNLSGRKNLWLGRDDGLASGASQGVWGCYGRPMDNSRTQRPFLQRRCRTISSMSKACPRKRTK